MRKYFYYLIFLFSALAVFISVSGFFPNNGLLTGPNIGLKLEETLVSQNLGEVWPFNPLKYAIRRAVDLGVPINTLVLLLLLPSVASIIAVSRHFVGLKGFGIFLPAALSVVFVAIGPGVGLGLFLMIVFVSTGVRLILRRNKFRLQYLPRMALILWVVSVSVLSVLFLAPKIGTIDLAGVSIFPILILALLAEDFTRVQIGKSVRTAINLTTETLILALLVYVFITLPFVQKFALLKPELLLIIVFVTDILAGKYVGLRLLEFWRFRKLINS